MELYFSLKLPTTVVRTLYSMEIPPVYVSQVGGGLEVNLHVKVNSSIKVVQHILHVLLFQVENSYIECFFNNRVVTLVAENSGCMRLLW